MTNEQFHTLRPGDHVRALSGRVYRVLGLRTLQVSAVQIRDGQPFGAARLLKPGGIELVPVVDAQHPANVALTAMLLPYTPTALPAKTTANPVQALVQRRNESDDDFGDRLMRHMARIATAWQRNYPCPPMTDEPELHALWMNVERMLAHAKGQR